MLFPKIYGDVGDKMVSAHNGPSSSVQQGCCECKSLVLHNL